MKRLIYFVALALLCVSCNEFDGPVISEDLDLRDFDAIQVDGYADILFTQADTYGVTLRTRESFFDRVKIRVKGRTLVIDTKSHFQWHTEDIIVHIAAPCLKRIDVDGAARFELRDGLFSDDDLKIHVDGAGQLDLSGISVRDLEVEIDGAGEVFLDGEAENASLEIDGAGTIDARYLQVYGRLWKHISGFGEILL